MAQSNRELKSAQEALARLATLAALSLEIVARASDVSHCSLCSFQAVTQIAKAFFRDVVLIGGFLFVFKVYRSYRTRLESESRTCTSSELLERHRRAMETCEGIAVFLLLGEVVGILGLVFFGLRGTLS